MTFDQIRSKFGDLIERDRGDSFMAPCPGHEDSKPSLSVTKGGDGKTLVKCFAGCDIKRILSPLGLKECDLFEDKPKTAKPKKSFSPVVASYDYRDQYNKLVFQVQRKANKDFLQRHPDPDKPGEWIYNLKGVKKVLYRLPELLASSPDKGVFLCEGEKDADRAHSIGLVATTNAGGAGKWQDVYSQYLVGRRVVFLPDNDGPGREHVLKVGAQLIGVAASLHVLELPGLPEKGDVSDWLDAGHDAAELVELAEKAPTFAEWSAEQQTAEPEAEAEEAPAAKLPLSQRIKNDFAKLGYEFSLNESSQEIIVSGAVLDDTTAATIRVEMRDLDYKNMKAVEDLYISEAGKNRFHPIKDYFDSLEWDGRNHILTLSKYLEDNHEPIPGPHDTAQRVSHVWLKRFLVGAVAKVLRPGSQNAMLVLAGGQDLGKSTFVRWLCSPLPKMHEESAIDPDNKEHVRKLASTFIWEVSELGSTTRKADIESLKAFLTRMDVSYRVPYARHPVSVPAIASFIGTINPTQSGFLNDETGSRRFNVLELVNLDWGYEANVDINQLWAQAVTLFNAGEPWRLSEAEVLKRKEINLQHEIVDPMEDFFHTYYTVDPTRANELEWQLDPTLLIEHLREREFRDGDKQLATRAGIVLKRMGIDRKRSSAEGLRVRFYAGIKRKTESSQPKIGYTRQPIE